MVLQLREGGSLGPVIATTQPLFLQNLGSQFTTFLFAANVSITPNQTYYIQPTVEGGGVLSIAFKSPSGYLRGDLISNGLTDPLADLWFREGLVIPEPAIGWLALLGAGGIWLYNRRRRGDRGGE
jgi:hypothetical protein